MNTDNTYNPAAFRTFITKLVRQKAIQISKEQEGKLLDVGCGDGLFLSKLAKTNTKLDLFGIDNDPIVLEKAQNDRNKLNQNINLSLQDGKNTIFPDNYFNIITLLTLTININNMNILKNFLEEMFRICKPEGKIILEFRNGSNLLLKLKYLISSKIQGIPIEAYTKNNIRQLTNDFQPSSIEFIPVGLNFSWLTLSYLAIIEV